MAIDFTFDPDVEDIRQKVRDFLHDEVRPRTENLRREDRQNLFKAIIELRGKAKQLGLWLPHMPQDVGGMGLGPTALAAVSAECSKVPLGPFILNCQAPDEGNMHTLHHFGTDEQKEKFLKPLLDGVQRSCFAMTEPEVAGSDPTLIQTKAELDGDQWVINGHKWFITGAQGAHFAIVICKTDPDAEIAQARNSAIIVPTDTPGFEIVRDVKTMSGSHNHCELRFTDCRVPKGNLLGRRGGGHELGQVRLGPARLAHCMRWIGQVETALDLMTDRALNRYAHGSYLADKQGIQWMLADSARELYAAKLMVLHAAYRIEHKLPFKTEVSMAKHHVANTLWRVLDRALQIHGALGYSDDSPISSMLAQARWSRLADGADEVHQMRTAEMVVRAFKEDGTTRRATGDLPL